MSKDYQTVGLYKHNQKNKISIEWESKNESWMSMYNLAKSYYEHHGNLLVQKTLKQ